MSDVSPRDAILRYPLFALFDPAAVDAWLQSGIELTGALGETVFEAGTPGRYAFVVLAGRVRVFKPGEQGREVSLGTFGPGEVFGEYALVPPHVNTATCRAADSVRLLRLPLSPVRKQLKRRATGEPGVKDWMRLHAIVRHVRGQASLGFQSATSFVPLLESCQEVAFSAGEAIQAFGLNADRWFVLTGGRARMIGADGNDRELRPCDSFGERALLGGHDLPLVEAAGEATCLALRREVFDPATAHADHLQSTMELARRPPPKVWIAQREATDCGVAALVMAARQIGIPTSLEEVGRLVKRAEEGITLRSLQRAAGRLGLAAQAVRVAGDQLRNLSLPAVAHLSSDHYVTLFEVVHGHVVFGDPLAGMRKMTVAEFVVDWSGQLLMLAKKQGEASEPVQIPSPLAGGGAAEV